VLGAHLCSGRLYRTRAALLPSMFPPCPLRAFFFLLPHAPRHMPRAFGCVTRQVAELRAVVAGKDRVLTEQTRDIERLAAAQREGGRAAECADEQRHKYRELKAL